MAAGFCFADVLPFPKSQLHDVGVPDDRSWNCTTSGAQPASGLAVKFATGSCAFTVVKASKSDRIAVILRGHNFSFKGLVF